MEDSWRQPELDTGIFDVDSYDTVKILVVYYNNQRCEGYGTPILKITKSNHVLSYFSYIGSFQLTGVSYYRSRYICASAWPSGTYFITWNEICEDIFHKVVMPTIDQDFVMHKMRFVSEKVRSNMALSPCELRLATLMRMEPSKVPIQHSIEIDSVLLEEDILKCGLRSLQNCSNDWCGATMIASTEVSKFNVNASVEVRVDNEWVRGVVLGDGAFQPKGSWDSYAIKLGYAIKLENNKIWYEPYEDERCIRLYDGSTRTSLENVLTSSIKQVNMTQVTTEVGLRIRHVSKKLYKKSHKNRIPCYFVEKLNRMIRYFAVTRIQCYWKSLRIHAIQTASALVLQKVWIGMLTRRVLAAEKEKQHRLKEDTVNYLLDMFSEISDIPRYHGIVLHSSCPFALVKAFTLHKEMADDVHDDLMDRIFKTNEVVLTKKVLRHIYDLQRLHSISVHDDKDVSYYRIYKSKAFDLESMNKMDAKPEMLAKTEPQHCVDTGLYSGFGDDCDFDSLCSFSNEMHDFYKETISACNRLISAIELSKVDAAMDTVKLNDYERLYQKSLNMEEELRVTTEKLNNTTTLQECSVCMNDTATICLIPCGHVCLCSSCFELNQSRLHHCPKCRTGIQLTVRIFA